MMSYALVLLTLAIGVLLGWLMQHWRQKGLIIEARADLERDLVAMRERVQAREAQLVARDREIEEKTASFAAVDKKFADTFKSLSSEALQASNQNFMDLARSVFDRYQNNLSHAATLQDQKFRELFTPLKESLVSVDSKISELERVRVGAYEGLKQQIHSLNETQMQLRGETSNLVRALRAPQTRGRWGEIQLRRVVEMAGMLNHCDFFEQQTVDTENGARRPDMVVRLPGGKSIVVDAKVPLMAYLEAIEQLDDNARRDKMLEHAAQVRRHMMQLSQKSYWDQFQPSPEFVVLFLPGEPFFSAALEADPSLLEAGVAQRVILATPTTLIALLRSVAYGWRQESLAANAQAISELGRQLYQRLSGLTGYMGDLGRQLGNAVGSYNKAIANLESRVLVSARKFEDLQADDPEKEIETLASIDLTAKLPEGLAADFIPPERPLELPTI